MPVSPRQIVQELGRRFNPCHQQMIAGAGARHVKQVPFGVVDHFEIGIVRDILNALLRRDNLVVAPHCYVLELYGTCGILQMVAQYVKSHNRKGPISR